MISVVIADDETVARARLRRLLGRDADVKIVAECATGPESVAAVLEKTPDVVFLDIQMPGLSGFQVLEALGESRLPIFVFVTAFSQYALDAFRVEALDYLLKPFSTVRFDATMTRIRQRMGGATTTQRQLLSALREISDAQDAMRAVAVSREEDAPPAHFLDRLAVKDKGRVYFVRVPDIDFIEAASNYVKLHVGRDVHMLRERLGELATRLNPRHFARIHRTSIVNVDRIKEIQPWFSGDAVVILNTGHKLRVSRMYRSSLELGTRSRL